MHEGDLFAGRYLVERTLGTGGLGVVYRVLDERLHRPAALKVMDPHLSHDPTFRERFEQEAKAGARFAHPNVVQVHHYAEHEGMPYLVMDYVEGDNLRAVLARTGPFTVTRTAEVVRQVAAALDATHRAGYAHCDVKPANILLGRSDLGTERARLTDFGLARPLQGGDQHFAGTVAYSCPEQLRGEEYDARSDLYSLACVTYECLSGRPPFTGASDLETAESHLHHTPPDLSVVVPGLSPAVAAVVARGLAKHPEDRPTSAGAFAAELEAAVLSPDATQAIAAVPLPARTPTALAARPRRSHRVLLVAGGAVIAAAFAVGLTAGLGNDGGADPSGSGATPTAGTDTRAALLRRLPPSTYAGCVPAPEREGKGRTASVTCTPPLPGADELLVSQWVDAATMAADFAATSGKRPDGKCGRYTGVPPSGLRSTWGNDAPLACYVNANGAAIVMWEYPDLAVQVLAVRRDGDARAAFAWWLKAVDAPLT